MTVWRRVLWILCLAMLSVGARNFELGLSIDGPLYATIARNIARSGEWFLLNGGISDFNPFYEHPHLGFWLQALVFKVLPAADWAARITGHLFYVAFLYLFFVTLKGLYRERVAILGVLILWIWAPFSNYFSNFYLDPGALFFGSFFLYALYRAFRAKNIAWAVVAGLALAACFMQKGLTALGFGLPAALLCVGFLRHDWRKLRLWLLPALCVFTTAVVLAIYVAAISRSAAPEFLSQYWQRQVGGRFSGIWDWRGLVSVDFWKVLLKHSYYFLLAVPVVWFLPRRPPHCWLPLSIFVSFLLMFAPAQRIGAQYLLMLLPSVAWFAALLIDRYLPARWSAPRLLNFSQTLAVVAVLAIQYLPYPTHNRPPPVESGEIVNYYAKNPKLERKVWVVPKTPFTYLATLAWYSDAEIVRENPERQATLKITEGNLTLDRQWCNIKSFEKLNLLRRCGDPL